MFKKISNCFYHQNSLERQCTCLELYENCFRKNITLENRLASHLLRRKYAFFGLINYFNKFLCVLIIRTLWKSIVHAKYYTRTVLEKIELLKIDWRLTSTSIDIGNRLSLF